MSDIQADGGRKKKWLKSTASLTAMLALAGAATLWLGWQFFALHGEMERVRTHDHRLLELAGEIVHLDEVLTMSARMAAATLNPAWEERYRRFEPQLDAAIKESLRIEPRMIGEFTSQTDAANIKLVEMEKRVFDLVRRKDQRGATAILFSPEYESQKQIYADGIRKLTATLDARAHAAIDAQGRRIRMAFVTLLVVLAVLSFFWLALLRTSKRRAEAEHRARLATEQARAELEKRVTEATADLRAVNQRLEQEMEVRRRSEEALQERIKELSCFQEIRTSLHDALSVEGLCRMVIEQAARGMQFPEIVATLIALDNQRFTFGRWAEGLKHGLHADIEVAGRHRGRLSVFYTENRPFLLPEGQNLVNAIADILSRRIDSLEMNEELLRERNNLKQVFDASPVGLLLMDENTVITAVNDVAAKLVAKTSTEMVNRQPGEALGCLHATEHPGGCGKGSACSSCPIRSTIEGVLRSGQAARGLEVQPALVVGGVQVSPWLELNADPLVIAGRPHVLASVVNITGRKRAEEALRESEKRFKLAAESSSDLIFEWDIKERLDWFGKIDELLGYSPSEFPRTFEAWANSVHPEDRDRVIVAIKNHLEKNEPYKIEFRVRKKDGTYNYWWVRGKAIRDEKGNPYRWVGAVTDVTERKQAGEALQKSESKYRTLVENLPQKIFLKDLDSIYTSCNEHYANDLRIAPPDIVGKTDYDFYPKELAEKYRADDKRIMELGQTEEIEEKYIQDGRDGWIYTTKTPLMDDNGKVSGILGIFWDITERKRAEGMLSASEERYRTLFEGAAEGILVADIESKQFKYVNPAICRILGYTAEELTRLSLADIHPKEALDYVVAEFEAMARGEKTLSPEIPGLRKDGSVIYTSVASAPLVIDGRKCIVGFFTDITERRRAEEALQESEKLYRALIETSPDAILLADTNTNFIMVNQMAVRLYGYQNVGEMIGKTFLDHIAPEERPRLFEHFKKTLQTGNSQTIEHTALKKDGSLFSAEVNASMLVDTQGRPQGTIAIVRDITERKQAEEALGRTMEALEQTNTQLKASIERADQMTIEARTADATKSEFLANMSHEIRTPMNGIIGMTGLLVDTELTEEQRQYAKIIRTSGEALLGLINNILDFSKIEARKLDLEILDFDLRATLEDTAELLAVKAQEKGLNLVCLVEPEVPVLLRGDPGRLRQIIFNMGGNAIKFTQQGGVTLRASLEAEDERQVTVRFAVSDTGIGIPLGKQEILFSPFTQVDGSTTRKYGGTGLGLAISRQLVELMGGAIGLKSEEGQGATFWFTAVFEKQPAGRILEPAPLADLAGVRVLVVDDHDNNRLLVTTLLKSWDCRFSEAADGEAALDLLRKAARAGDPYPVALLDMYMPGMTGAELGRRIKEDSEICGTRLIMMTSLGERGDAARLTALGFAGYLPKPLRQSQLRDCLALVLGRDETPQATDSPAAGLVTRHTVSETQKRRARILLAEDNATNQLVALKILEKLGYRADAVANGQEAIAALQNIPYDLVLMDCQMPEMDGFEATPLIRGGNSGVRDSAIPIIAMTAYAMKGDRERCLDAGMSDYLSKPVQPKELAAALERWLNKDGDTPTAAIEPSDRERSISSKESPGNAIDLSDDTADVAIFDREAFLERVMDDAELACEIVRGFLADMPTQIEELASAVAAGDGRLAEQQAHKIKGAAASLGGKALSEKAFEMENAGEAGDIESR
jgi:two-component system sensor histidine kinase/response regulator